MNATISGKPPYHGSVTEHIRLLNFGRDVASELIKDPDIQNAAAPILLHQDLHKRNIFVSEEDHTIITGIIDWQSSSVNPAFMHANEVPDFAARSSTTADHISLGDFQARTNANLCSEAFSAGIKILVPKLYSTWRLDDDVTRFFEYCHRTYRDGAGVFRQVLIDLAKRWKELGQARPCPYPLPTPEEWLDHRKEYKALEDAQELKKFIMSRLNTAADGWVPTEAWKETSEDHQKLYDEFLQIMGEQELREVWPFDKPCSTL